MNNKPISVQKLYIRPPLSEPKLITNPVKKNIISIKPEFISKGISCCEHK